MQTVRTLRQFEQIKTLADARRLAILRLLMSAPATLSQLAKTVSESPAWVRHHIKALESAGLVEISEIRANGIVIEKYYRAKAGAFILQETILPDSRDPIAIFAGSHDFAIELLAERITDQLNLMILPVGSLDGLLNLRQGVCQLSGAHILDESGEYNTPFARRIFPERNVALYTLAHRAQGLLVAVGNPKGIKTLSDLGRQDVTFLNRNPGSGTRIWLERELARIGLSPSLIRGFGNFVHTHSQSARAVQQGEVDVSLGLQAAAAQHNLGFLPLFEERYDLVIPLERQALLAPLLEEIQTASFRQAVEAFTGYNVAHCGELVLL